MALLALPGGRRSAAPRSGAAALVHRLAVGLAGTVTVLVGLALVPLPGPGWPVVLLGVSLLGTEFAWAARLSGAVTQRVGRARTRLRAAGWPCRAAATAGLVACAVLPVLLL